MGADAGARAALVEELGRPPLMPSACAPKSPSELEAELEILRQSIRPWASILTAGVTISVLLSGSGSPAYVLACGSSLLLLHSFRVPRWGRAALLLLAIAAIIPCMAYVIAHGEPGAGPLYGMVVFTVVFHTRRLEVVVATAVALIVLGGAYEGWTILVSGAQAFGFLLVVPSALMFAFSYSWRKSVLSEHERAKLGRTLTNQNRTLRRALLVLDQLGAAEERDRIAREIHDRLGHNLTSTHVYLEAARRHLGPGNDKALLAITGALEATSLGLREVRECVQHLRESNDALPLAERCRRTIERFALHEKVELLIDGDETTVARQLHEVLLRCLQESLTNVARHSEADHVVVRLYSNSSRLELLVQDDGQGCGDLREGFGLQGMRERVLDLGGHVEIQTSAGSGFSVRVCFPRNGTP
ncbi:MAG: sensor histidine kinase [Nannocystaceae bacterium]